MNERIPSGVRSRVLDRAIWAMFHMMRAGLVDRPRRGVYEISDAGRRALNDTSQEVNLNYLRSIPAYTESLGATAAEAQSGEISPGEAALADGGGDSTPIEAMAASANAVNAELADDLLSRILECSPDFFERLIVDLLIAMGYGRGMPDRGHALGRSGDGGIDGIVNEDALGLDAVYVQAKRYDPATNVGRPAIQQFVGSLTGEGASKGVFVTTSGFSRGARDYVEKVQQRIVLIDGQQLARLMIDHEVGVRGRRTYVLRSVDEDYFIEE